jgi:hypothetical protein
MRELSVAEQRYQAVMAVIGDGLAMSIGGSANFRHLEMQSAIQNCNLQRGR